jgi:hypothetical protein
MNLLTNSNTQALWQDVIKQAEHQCAIRLQGALESYLISLLMRYTNKPEIVKQIVAIDFLTEISNKKDRDKLQDVGDQCLLFAGLFPGAAEKRLVKVSYFVGLGQGAYATISQCADDLFNLLALEFVDLMDVLQSIRQGYDDLLPLSAYEQWNDVGSQRALKVLQAYSNAIPLKKIY